MSLRILVFITQEELSGDIEKHALEEAIRTGDDIAAIKVNTERDLDSLRRVYDKIIKDPTITVVQALYPGPPQG